MSVEFNEAISLESTLLKNITNKFGGLNLLEIETKSWGFCFSICQTESFRVDLCCIKKGGYSSQHHHIYSINKFFVLSGELEIKYASRVEPYILGDNQSLRQLTIHPSIPHRFKALTDVQLLEIYYTVCSDTDIVRQDTGGINNEE